MQQANLRAQMGFWQVYAYAIVVVDAREQNAGKDTYAGLSTKLQSLMDSAVSTRPLDERVGLVTLTFTQPRDRAPLGEGRRHLHLIRRAETVMQSQELTNWVAKIVSQPC